MMKKIGLMMNYSSIEETLKTSADLSIDFREYKIVGLDKKDLILDISGYKVIGFISPNEFIDRDTVKRYYGEEADFLNLCYYPYLRLIIKKPNSLDDKEYILHLNKASFTNGLQEIDLYKASDTIQSIGGIQPWIG